MGVILRRGDGLGNGSLGRVGFGNGGEKYLEISVFMIWKKNRLCGSQGGKGRQAKSGFLSPGRSCQFLIFVSGSRKPSSRMDNGRSEIKQLYNFLTVSFISSQLACGLDSNLSSAWDPLILKVNTQRHVLRNICNSLDPNGIDL
jgi:hypothetical protein